MAMAVIDGVYKEAAAASRFEGARDEE